LCVLLSALEGPFVHKASLLCKASQDFTNGNGFHNANGGPDRAINIREEVCFAESRDLKFVQTRFMRLNPLSHSAVLTGIVSTKCNESAITLSPLSLKSLYAFLASLKPKPNFLHNSFKSVSPYSGGTSFATAATSSTSTALHKVTAVGAVASAEKVA